VRWENGRLRKIQGKEREHALAGEEFVLLLDPVALLILCELVEVDRQLEHHPVISPLLQVVTSDSYIKVANNLDSNWEKPRFVVMRDRV